MVTLPPERREELPGPTSTRATSLWRVFRRRFSKTFGRQADERFSKTFGRQADDERPHAFRRLVYETGREVSGSRG